MKRYGFLYKDIISLENLSIAFDKATKGKKRRDYIQSAIQNKDILLEQLHLTLLNHTYTTSQYSIKTVHEPKERIIYVLPFFPDRIVHHAIMNIIEPILDKKMIADTYACRKGKGQTKASDKCQQYVCKYQYVLQLDVKKFYPSIPHNNLKHQLRFIFKDNELLWLLDNIIDSIDGERNVPIGNYLSQWFGNIYLNKLDRYIISLGFSKIVRYCDDLLVFSNSKTDLQILQQKLNRFIHLSLDLEFSRSDIIKTSKGIKFLGYRHFPDGHRLIKKKTALRIKQRLQNLPYQLQHHLITVDKARGQVASALGWFSHCNSYHLQQHLNFKSLCEATGIFQMKDVYDFLDPKERLGIRLPIQALFDKPVSFYGAKICKRKNKEFLRLHFKLLDSHLTESENVYVSFTESKRLIYLFLKYQNQLPFTAKLIKTNKAYSLGSIRGEIMKGFPKHLNSKEDYLYIKDNFEKTLWLPEFQKLLDSMKDWVYIKQLDNEANGITDETHKVISFEDLTTKQLTYAQYELQVIPTAKIFQLGFSVQEVQSIIDKKNIVNT